MSTEIQPMGGNMTLMDAYKLGYELGLSHGRDRRAPAFALLAWGLVVICAHRRFGLDGAALASLVGVVLMYLIEGLHERRFREWRARQ